MVAKIKKFVGDVVAEMKKVAWPNKEQLKESTTVVVVVSLILTLIVFVIDQVMTFAMKAVY